MTFKFLCCMKHVKLLCSTSGYLLISCEKCQVIDINLVDQMSHLNQWDKMLLK